VLIDLDVRPPATAATPSGIRGRVGLALAAVVLVLQAGGAAAPRPGLPEVAAVPGPVSTAVVLTGDAVYTARENGDIGAVPLHPGGPEWTLDTGDTEPYLFMLGSLLAVAGTAFGDITLLDPRTGQKRWQPPPGATVRTLGAHVVLGGADGLRVIDPATGRTVWSRPAMTGLFAADDEFLVTAQDGRVAVLAAADGRVVAGPRQLSVDNEQLLARVIGDNLVIFDQSGITAYARSDLTRRWQRANDDVFDLNACGQWLCLATPTGLAVLDPRTGAERWTDDRWSFVHDDGIAIGGDAIVVRIDLATGRVLDEFGLGGTAGDLMLHVEKDRTLITRLADGGFLGSLPPVAPSGCAREGVHLACPVLGGTVRVWRVG
jgi:outer membrane protein assembly factor BamB